MGLVNGELGQSKTRLNLSSDRRIIAAVPAAGIGRRFGGSQPKQFVEVAGRAVLAWTLERLLRCDFELLIVAIEGRLLDSVPSTFPDYPGVRWIAGGSSRQASVERCLQSFPGSPEDTILVHDGARPAVSGEDLTATLEAAQMADGAVLGRSVADTVKQVVNGEIRSTVDRTALFRAETPQVFRRGILERAIEQGRRQQSLATDEASLVEQLPDMKILAVEAKRPNPKLTRPSDLAYIAWLLSEMEV